MELVPKDTQEPQEDNTYLSDRAVFAHNLNHVRGLGKKSTLTKKERGLAALHDVFQLIGGVPRLAIHADENPQEFYQLYFRYTQTVEKHHHHSIRILAPSIPPTALDGDITDIEFEEVQVDANGTPKDTPTGD